MYRRRCIKAPGDVPELGLLINLTVAISSARGNWHALTNLNEGWVTLGGLDLLNAAALTGRAAADNTNLIAAVFFAASRLYLDITRHRCPVDAIAAFMDHRRILRIDADEQSAGFVIQLR